MSEIMMPLLPDALYSGTGLSRDTPSHIKPALEVCDLTPPPSAGVQSCSDFVTPSHCHQKYLMKYGHWLILCTQKHKANCSKTMAQYGFKSMGVVFGKA